MDQPVRILDDGAWVSVGDSREVGVSDIWRVEEHAFCGCETADVLLEAFFDVRTRGDRVEARPVGRCIACGTQGSLGWLTVGQLEEDGFEPVDPDEGHVITPS